MHNLQEQVKDIADANDIYILIELLDQFMEKYSDRFEWVRPKAGAIAYVKFKGPLTSEELGEQLAESGISI